MTTTVTLIPGDGIVGELVEPMKQILAAANAQVEFDEQPAGRRAFEDLGEPLPQTTIDSVRRHRVALKGKLQTPQGSGYSSPNGQLRTALDLFANVRPLKNLRGLPSRHQDIDIVVVRESTEDIYAGLEHVVTQGVVASLKVVTEKACDRIARFAFDYARKNNRKKVTLVHKANIMKRTDGLFLRVARKVAEDYADIPFNALIVDNASMQLIMRPHQYDVLLCGNMYGDILSDLGAGIIGGISPTWGVSKSDEISVFESIHGDAPHLEGKGVANPLPLLMPAQHMLRHLGQSDVANRILGAIEAVLTKGEGLTPDLGGNGTTQSMTDAIIGHL